MLISRSIYFTYTYRKNDPQHRYKIFIHILITDLHRPTNCALLFKMYFSTTSTFAIIVACLATSGSTFKIETFTDTQCTIKGESPVDIWDDSCAKWPKSFQSYKVLNYGSENQVGYFYSGKKCRTWNIISDIKVFDGAPVSERAELNKCYQFGSKTAQAVGSHKSATT